nr:MAG TPA: hypothetical protein [Bacteriophage sp.]
MPVPGGGSFDKDNRPRNRCKFVKIHIAILFVNNVICFF